MPRSNAHCPSRSPPMLLPRRNPPPDRMIYLTMPYSPAKMRGVEVGAFGGQIRVRRLSNRRRRQQMGPDEREIREVHSTWISAVNAGDLARLLTMMADDVVFLGPGQAPFGRGGFSANF